MMIRKTGNHNAAFKESTFYRTRTPFYIFILIISWSVVTVVAIVWDLYRQEEISLNLAAKEARANFDKDQAFRSWVTSHGGVYVPVDERTPPNPFLAHLPERELTTPSGKRLTLMNPAYALRQMMDEYKELYGIRGRITSLNPLNPDNAPDLWETAALRQFSQGAQEICDVTEINKEPYLRLIRPMVTDLGCLKCHGHQGYREGDIRGGVGVSVPLKGYMARQLSEMKTTAISHVVIWSIGMLVLLSGFFSLKRQHEEQQQAKQALVESEEKYRLAMDATLDGLWDWDVTSGTVVYSPSWTRILGQADVAPDYTAWESRIHPDDKPLVLESLERHLKGETESWSKTHRLKAKDGSYKWVLGRGKVVQRSEGNLPIRMVGTMSDISLQKNTEQALKESETRFKALHNASFGGIAIHDQGVILDCNQGLSTISGYAPEELIGMNGLELMAPEWREIAMDHILTGWEKPYEVMGLRKNGKTFPLRLEARNMPFKGRNVRVVEFKDITEEKKAEAEHEKLLDQLAQARKMESVGRLAGGVAHDFNNMLSIIIGNTELMLEDLDQNSPLVGNLKEVFNAAERSAHLTRQLLAFARKQPVDPRVLDVNEKILEMLNMIQRLIGEGIKLLWQPQEGIWPVRMDPSQLDQVMANLCINARDAIQEIGTVKIETRNVILSSQEALSYPEAAAGAYVAVSVRDNGSGMDSHTVANLFEPFFTTKEMGHGSGLGLATVYGIVKQNRGFISVDSCPGKGTTFHIFFPRYHEAGRKEVALAVREMDLSGNETIMLVEDETSILEMAATMLSRLGYRVLAADSPGRAIRIAAEKQHIDLLITDVVMPEMNGKRLAEWLGKRFPEMKCLFMSGYTADIIANHGVLDEGIEFLSKPFTLQDLARRVRAVLDDNES